MPQMCPTMKLYEYRFSFFSKEFLNIQMMIEC